MCAIIAQIETEIYAKMQLQNINKQHENTPQQLLLIASCNVVHTHTHTHTYTQAATHTHTHTHTHTCTQR